MEAPDECGHHGDAKNKIFSIEQIDSLVVRPIVEELKKRGEPFRILIAPDHPTPISTMTHCSDPVPYILYDSQKTVNGVSSYTEDNAKSTGVFIEDGYKLAFKLING